MQSFIIQVSVVSKVLAGTLTLCGGSRKEALSLPSLPAVPVPVSQGSVRLPAPNDPPCMVQAVKVHQMESQRVTGISATN